MQHVFERVGNPSLAGIRKNIPGGMIMFRPRKNPSTQLKPQTGDTKINPGRGTPSKMLPLPRPGDTEKYSRGGDVIVFNPLKKAFKTIETPNRVHENKIPGGNANGNAGNFSLPVLLAIF